MSSGQLSSKPVAPVDDLIFDVYKEDNETISVLKFIKVSWALKRFPSRNRGVTGC